MSDLTLVLGTLRVSVSTQAIRLHSSFVVDHPGTQSYIVQSCVSPQAFREFLRAIQDGSDLRLTADNCSELSLLCKEFGARRLERACEDFVPPVSPDAGIEFRLKNLESAFQETVPALRSTVEKLTAELGSLKADLANSKFHLKNLESAFEETVPALPSTVEKLKAELGSLKADFEKSKLESEERLMCAIRKLSQDTQIDWVHQSQTLRE
jgi:hypothetical protein